MQIRRQHLTDRFRVHSLTSVNTVKDTDILFQEFIGYVAEFPQRFNLMMLDCFTPFVEKATSRSKVDMLLTLKGICGKDKSIIVVTDSHIFDKETHFRVFAMSDYYF